MKKISFPNPENKEHYDWWKNEMGPFLEEKVIEYNVMATAGTSDPANNGIPSVIEVSENDEYRIREKFGGLYIFV